MLLKGLLEVRDAANPITAAEMALVRLAYAADLPPTERLVRDLISGDAQPAPRAAPTPAPSGTPRASAMGATAAAVAREPAPQLAPQPVMSTVPAVELASLEDIVALAKARGARMLATQLETNVHLVALEKGRIEFRPNATAPATLQNDLSSRLRDWTGIRWFVTTVKEGGGPTIAETRAAAERAKKDAVSQEPFVRAVLDAFPGAEIVAVRDITKEPGDEEATGAA
jgi:DNA polymerase-3 subunit gamma/tau